MLRAVVSFVLVPAFEVRLAEVWKLRAPASPLRDVAASSACSESSLKVARSLRLAAGFVGPLARRYRPWPAASMNHARASTLLGAIVLKVMSPHERGWASDDPSGCRSERPLDDCAFREPKVLAKKHGLRAIALSAPVVDGVDRHLQVGSQLLDREQVREVLRRAELVGDEVVVCCRHETPMREVPLLMATNSGWSWMTWAQDLHEQRVE